MTADRQPERTCVGCRKRFPQAALVRFVQAPGGWTLASSRARPPGRGAYVCSAACASALRKNKRFAALAEAAATFWSSARVL